MNDDIEQVAYSHTRHCGVLFMHEGHVATMDRAVALFECIDPAVERVLAYSGNQHTSEFVRRNGAWTESPTMRE